METILRLFNSYAENFKIKKYFILKLIKFDKGKTGKILGKSSFFIIIKL